MVLKPIREIKKRPVCQLGKGTRLLVPRHQNSGAWTPELWCPYLIFVAVLSMHIYSCWQCLKKKKTVSANTLLMQNLVIVLQFPLEWTTSMETVPTQYTDRSVGRQRVPPSRCRIKQDHPPCVNHPCKILGASGHIRSYKTSSVGAPYFWCLDTRWLVPPTP